MNLLLPLTELKLVGDVTKIYLIRKGLLDEVWHFSNFLSLTFLYHSIYIFIYYYLRKYMYVYDVHLVSVSTKNTKEISLMY